MEKVGIMGGTFNPIHNGHLILAENAYEQIGLDRILFMPSLNPPHKTQIHLISSEDRLKMVELAISNNPHFITSDFELKRPGMTYTSDTLTILNKENPGTEYYFIVGADSLFEMTGWHDPQTIFKLCTVVAASRNNLPKDKLDSQKMLLNKTYGAKIIILDMPTIELSSASIRERAALKKSIRYLVPDEVNEYILSHNLYNRS